MQGILRLTHDATIVPIKQHKDISAAQAGENSASLDVVLVVLEKIKIRDIGEAPHNNHLLQQQPGTSHHAAASSEPSRRLTPAFPSPAAAPLCKR
jgi:hypothetical protein